MTGRICKVSNVIITSYIYTSIWNQSWLINMLIASMIFFITIIVELRISVHSGVLMSEPGIFHFEFYFCVIQSGENQSLAATCDFEVSRHTVIRVRGGNSLLWIHSVEAFPVAPCASTRVCSTHMRRDAAMLFAVTVWSSTMKTVQREQNLQVLPQCITRLHAVNASKRVKSLSWPICATSLRCYDSSVDAVSQGL